MLRALLCCLVMMLVASPALAQSSAPTTPVQVATNRIEEVQLRHKLANQRMKDVDLRDMQLGQALRQLAEKLDANLFINEPALRESGVDLSRKLTLNVQFVPIGVAMDLALSEASAGQALATIIVHGNVIVCTSSTDADALRGKRSAFSPEVERLLQLRETVDDRRVTELDLKHVPFEEAINTLRDQIGSDINVNWAELENEGIDRGTEVSLKVSDAAFGEVLERILEQLGGGFSELDYAVTESGVYISSKNGIDRKTVTETIDFAPFLAAHRVNSSRDAKGNDELMEELVELITNTVDRDSWTVFGGTVGNVSTIDTKMVITHRPDVLAEIRVLVQKLEGTAL